MPNIQKKKKKKKKDARQDILLHNKTVKVQGVTSDQELFVMAKENTVCQERESLNIYPCVLSRIMIQAFHIHTLVVVQTTTQSSFSVLIQQKRITHSIIHFSSGQPPGMRNRNILDKPHMTINQYILLLLRTWIPNQYTLKEKGKNQV